MTPAAPARFAEEVLKHAVVPVEDLQGLMTPVNLDLALIPLREELLGLAQVERLRRGPWRRFVLLQGPPLC